MIKTPFIDSIHGRLFHLLGDIPDPGTDIFLTVPDRRRWKLLSLNAVLTTDATVANRTVVLRLVLDPDTLIFIPCTVNQPASQTFIYCFAHFGSTQLDAASPFNIAFPQLHLTPGTAIRTTTTNMQDGDQFAAPILYIEEWIDP